MKESPPREIEKMLGAYEALRRLEFLPAEISVVLSRSALDADGPEHVFVQVRRDGRRYSLDCGHTACAFVDLGRWCEAWNKTMTNVDRERIWQTWLQLGTDFQVQLLDDLHARGLLARAN